MVGTENSKGLFFFLGERGGWRQCIICVELFFLLSVLVCFPQVSDRSFLQVTFHRSQVQVNVVLIYNQEN